MSVLQDGPGTDVEADAPLAPAVVRVPCVNLLPPEIAERQRFRRVQLALVGGLLTAAGVVALLHVAAVGATEQAAVDLAAAGSRGDALRADAAEFADVQRVHADAAAARSMLTEAMAGEIRFSTLLDDVSRNVPDDVWLENVTFAQETAIGATTTGPGVGTVSFSGFGGEHDDVATWLESLTGQPRFADATFARSAAADRAGRPSVAFTSSATLTDAALSRRYTDADGT